MQTTTDITEQDLENLKHMLGAVPKRPRYAWGCRNHFSAGPGAIPSMKRLEAAGFAKKGRLYGESYTYHATRSGCLMAGLDESQAAQATASLQ